MNLLLDTHVFIWLMESPEKVPAHVYAACENPDNSLFLSMVSIWEMQIKLGKGKLTMKQPLKNIIDEQQRDNRLGVLRLDLSHLWTLQALPDLHGDPFGRMLAAQAKSEDMLLVSGDRIISEYPVTIF